MAILAVERWIRRPARCALLAALGACASPALRCEDAREAMGTTFRVVAYTADAQTGARAIDAAFARIEELDDLLSDYDPASELSLLSARSATSAPTGWIPVSADLWTVLAAGQVWSERTGGAFDVTIGPFVRLWRRSRRQGELPRAVQLEEAARAVGHAQLRLDAERRAVELLAPGMLLDLGGIAKGFAADEALRVLRAHGIESALVAGGGDVAVGYAPPGKRGWRVEIEPFDAAEHAERVTLELERAAVSTSGDTYRFVEIEGRRYSHIVDPKTGLGLTLRIGASVVAPDGMSADALATAACVLGPELGLELLARTPNVQGRVVAMDENAPHALRTYETPGFARLALAGE